jgi:hypothetical protein
MKVGDKVKVIEHTSRGDLIGTIGVVASQFTGIGNAWWIEIDGNKFDFFGHQLEVVEEAEEKADTKWDEEKILDIAKGYVYGDRQGDYGHPADDYNRTAVLWSQILGVEVTAHQAILCMIAVKMSRLVNDPSKRDSIIDIAGYAECFDRVSKRLAGIE